MGDNIIIIKYNKALPNDFVIRSEPFLLESSYISYQTFKNSINKHTRIPNNILPINDKILFIINIKYKKKMNSLCWARTSDLSVNSRALCQLS